MKAVAIDRFGGIETLKTRELPIPDVGAGEVGVRVEAAGVGVWDPFEREGGFAKEFNVKPRFPLVLGSDGAGTVDAVGDNVRQFKKGDRVYGIAFLNPKGGFYSQYAVVKENSVSRIPGKLSMPQAAAMAVDAITALAGLDTTLGLKSGESVLILGASGGIGLSFSDIRWSPSSVPRHANSLQSNCRSSGQPVGFRRGGGWTNASVTREANGDITVAR
jgi:NADPH:quinone reductase-like Zn-dependent oxidoreductase